jgi:cellulose synthase/poly-beta-1,6-N-acetylglucosamine synthase-like glycosyltransferase
MTKRNRQLTLTVGLTTCYGDPSIVETIKSYRASKGIKKFNIILIADTVPLSADIKRDLRNLGVDITENRTPSSQIRKQKQIIAKCTTDILVLTQDDVLIDPNALATVLHTFERSPKTTLISIRNQPLPPFTAFEAALCVGTELANDMAASWRHGDNYLAVVGRFMALRTSQLRKMTLRTEVATSDAYYYLENKRVGGMLTYLPGVAIYFRNPQRFDEHRRKSSRFAYSQMEMTRYFGPLDGEYHVPFSIRLSCMAAKCIKYPVRFCQYIAILLATRLHPLPSDNVLNPIWKVDVSTKSISTATPRRKGKRESATHDDNV